MISALLTRTDWWAPVGLTMGLGLLFMTVFARRVGWENYISRQFGEEKARQKAPRLGIVVPIAAKLGLLAKVLLIAALFFVTARVLGSNCTFARAFSMTSYATCVPAAIARAIASAALFFRAPEQIEIEDPIGLNAAALLRRRSSRVLRQIEFFNIVSLLMLSSGLSMMTQRSWLMAAATTFITWFVWII